MITIQCLIDRKLPVSHVLTARDRIELLCENKAANVSYLSLLKEMLGYRGMTVESLLNGWGGVQLVKV